MRFLIFQDEDMISGEETVNEFRLRISQINLALYNLIVVNSELDLCSVAPEFWPKYETIVLAEKTVPLDEIKYHIVTWWIDNE